MSKQGRIRASINQELPEGWRYATLKELVAKDGVFSDGDWVESKDQDPDGEVRLIQLADIGDGKYKDKSDRHLTLDKAHELNCTFLRDGDVLVARMPDPLGRACIFPGDRKTACTVVDVCIVRTGSSPMNHRWLTHAVNAPQFRNTVASLESGTTRKRISRKNLARIEFPVPPLAQQERIAAKIEELFSDLEAGVADLKKTQKQLQRYRQSVLQATVEGRLTKDWREEHEAEPADSLLERILEERQAQWEKDYRAKYEAKGKKPPSGWKSRYKPPEGPDTSDLAKLMDLPEGWTWGSGNQVFRYVTSGSRGWSKYYSDNGQLFLRVGDISEPNISEPNIEIDFSDVQRVDLPDDERGHRSLLEPDDLLMSITADVGKVGLVPEGIEEAYINQHVALTRPSMADTAKYLAYFVVSRSGGQKQVRNMQRGATKAGLTLTDIKNLKIALPPEQELDRIVNRVERLLSVADEAAQTVKRELKRAERLRQSILKQAFSGKLVEQSEASEFAQAPAPITASAEGEQIEMPF